MQPVLFNCEAAQDLCALYTDGTLSNGTRQAVDAHLKSCADCRRFYKAYVQSARASDAALPQQPAVQPNEAPAQGYAALARKLRRRSRLACCLYSAATLLLALFSFLAARRLEADHRKKN